MLARRREERSTVSPVGTVVRYHAWRARTCVRPRSRARVFQTKHYIHTSRRTAAATESSGEPSVAITASAVTAAATAFAATTGHAQL